MIKYAALLQSADKKRGIRAKGETIQELLQNLSNNSQDMDKIWHFPVDTWTVRIIEGRTGKDVYHYENLRGMLPTVNVTIASDALPKILKMEADNAAKLDA